MTPEKVVSLSTPPAKKKAIIIGAGPAGLTAAYELLSRSEIEPVVLEMSTFMGGLSRTINYKGNRIDIGGHRFFSKSDRVMNWWLEMMPLQALSFESASEQVITYQRQSRGLEGSPGGPDPEKVDRVMLLRKRRSRIYFMRRFFDYPISLTVDTIQKLGLVRMFKIGCSYLRSLALPIHPEENLEEFFINRFGRELYRTFFKDYTEKVWGVPCRQISAAWGAQRTKGLSILKTLLHAVRRILIRTTDLRQKSTETSLIEQFLYPKFGPGQMWETVAAHIKDRGGTIVEHREVRKIVTCQARIVAVEAVNPETNQFERFEGDYFFSTMPVKDLIRSLDASVPDAIRAISEGLVYRDFITVGLLVQGLRIFDETPQGRKLVSDNWIYIQEPDVRVGRLQIFNNWSPYMVADPDTVWIGLEYFCNDTDEIWSLDDERMTALAIEELAKIGIIESSSVLDSTVVHMPKTYPGYFGTYDRFDELRAYLEEFENLYLIGRNGMHKYNNQDHSMLTAMVAVDNIVSGITSRENIWAVNTEMEYHEGKSGADSGDDTPDASHS